MYTGVGDVSKLGQIKSWKKRAYLKTWKNQRNGKLSTCNMINGTDTTVYAPFIKAGGFLDTFSSDVCR